MQSLKPWVWHPGCQHGYNLLQSKSPICGCVGKVNISSAWHLSKATQLWKKKHICGHQFEVNTQTASKQYSSKKMLIEGNYIFFRQVESFWPSFFGYFTDNFLNKKQILHSKHSAKLSLIILQLPFIAPIVIVTIVTLAIIFKRNFA